MNRLSYPGLVPSRRYWGIQPTGAAEHTMADRLRDYVLPKVAVPQLRECAGRVVVHGGTHLELLGGVKPERKLFNWRRPYVEVREQIVQCFTAPGADYAYHYARLYATACHLLGVPNQVEVEIPPLWAAEEFLERLLPASMPRSDVVVLGYVHALFASRRTPWTLHPGFGWSQATLVGSSPLLLGCEFSFWGDLAAALVTALARRGTQWVIYVGKLGTLNPGIIPNHAIATGHTSLIGDRSITWNGRLHVPASSGVLVDQVHATVGSILDETDEWYRLARDRVDVVDPEIGHMATAAQASGIDFDYLHLVSDNLSGGHRDGLYDERAPDLQQNRRRCLSRIEQLLTAHLAAQPKKGHP